MATETLYSPMSTKSDQILDLPNPSTMEDLEILDAPDEASDEDVSFDNLYAFLLANEDIIITIDEEAEDAVRRGLSVVKLNHTKKMKAVGEKLEEKTLKFQVVERIPATLQGEPNRIRLQIWLAKRSGIRVHRMIVSEKGL